MKVLFAAFVGVVLTLLAAAQPKHEITISGTSFLMDGQPFPYTGINFFNAIYNPAFNRSTEERRKWMQKFRRYGINVFRIWGQWDTQRGFIDTCQECTLYFPDGRLRQNNVERLKDILRDADQEEMVLALTLFSQESWHENKRLGRDEADRAVSALTRELMPYRNLTFQIWSEFDERTLDHLKTIKTVDPKRLATSAPARPLEALTGEFAALDYLTPHTSRQRAGSHWEIAPLEIGYLLARYRKPAVDDSPARNGTPKFGGPAEQTYPFDQIIQIYKIWQLGGYVHYHHDMFQTGYGTPPVPPSGIPDPEFSPYHRLVLEFMAQRDRYRPPAR